MSQRERDRLKVLREVQKEYLTQRTTGLWMGLTERWARRLLGRLRAVARVQEACRDLGPTLAAELPGGAGRVSARGRCGSGGA
jgi:hypothetical protein